MSLQEILQIVNLGIIPILIWLLIEDRKINASLRAELKDVNERLLVMVEKTEQLQSLMSKVTNNPAWFVYQPDV